MLATLKSAGIFFLMSMAPLASAEIFKCVAKNGLNLYQNFPCEFESLGWMPVDGQAPTNVSTSSGLNPALPKSTAGPLAVDSRTKTTRAGLQIGMTIEEIRAVWGDPIETEQEEPGHGPRSEVWTYSGNRSVRFDRKGRVTALRQ